MVDANYPKGTDGYAHSNDLTKIRSSDGKLLGEVDYEDEEAYGCGLEGCSGHAIYVNWPDGDETMICSDGLTMGEDGWWRISS